MIVNILVAPITNVSELTITVASNVYTGQVKQLSSLMTVTYMGEPVPASEYTLSGTTSATNAGTYTATLTGKNSLEGTRTISWTIGKANLRPSNRLVLVDGETAYSGPAPSSGNMDVSVRELGTVSNKLIRFGITITYTPVTQADTLQATAEQTDKHSVTVTNGQSQTSGSTYWIEKTLNFSSTSGLYSIKITFSTKNYSGTQYFHIYPA